MSDICICTCCGVVLLAPGLSGTSVGRSWCVWHYHMPCQPWTADRIPLMYGRERPYSVHARIPYIYTYNVLCSPDIRHGLSHGEARGTPSMSLIAAAVRLPHHPQSLLLPLLRAPPHIPNRTPRVCGFNPVLCMQQYIALQICLRRHTWKAWTRRCRRGGGGREGGCVGAAQGCSWALVSSIP